jgi:predicted ATP-grasp superfamily ATP-dependent carboligase
MKDTGITAALASKRFKGVDARKLASMAEEIEEEVAANSVAGGGVDMNPTGKAKWDKRSKFHIDHMFRRADGTKYQKKKKD